MWVPPWRLCGHSFKKVLSDSVISSPSFTQSPRCRQAHREILKNTHATFSRALFQTSYSLWRMNASLLSAHFRSMFSSYLSTQIPQVSLLSLVNEKEMANQWHFTNWLVTCPKYKRKGNRPEFQRSVKKTAPLPQLQNCCSNTTFSFSVVVSSLIRLAQRCYREHYHSRKSVVCSHLSLHNTLFQLSL